MIKAIELKKGDTIKSNQLGVETSGIVMESPKQGRGIKKNKENPAPRFAERGWLLSYRFDSSSTKPSIVSYIKVSTSFKVNVFFKFMK